MIIPKMIDVSVHSVSRIQNYCMLRKIVLTAVIVVV
jgi:hypothetical protein